VPFEFALDRGRSALSSSLRLPGVQLLETGVGGNSDLAFTSTACCERRQTPATGRAAERSPAGGNTAGTRQVPAPATAQAKEA